MTGKAKFNPLTDPVEALPKTKQSFDLAPDPEPAQEFDTSTPAMTYRAPRRFTLGDLPRYTQSLYEKLSSIFPHVNERSYPGWLKGCINDNACLFLCIDAQQGEGGAAGLAFIAREPLNPVPYVDVYFVIGEDSIRVGMYQEIVRWASQLGAHEVHIREKVADGVLKRIPGVESHETKIVVLDVGVV